MYMETMVSWACTQYSDSPILRQLKVSREPTIPHPTILTAQYSDTFTIFVFIAVLGSVSGLIQGLVVRLGLELVLEARLYG